ncbi:hypothetical protein HZS_3522 [Henneguya salminicola]|nr:hypothetical protein HZS_3522 [Henneguya salminicola]
MKNTIQNYSNKYFTVMFFVNQGLLCAWYKFDRNYANPIFIGIQVLATDKEREIIDYELQEAKRSFFPNSFTNLYSLLKLF